MGAFACAFVVRDGVVDMSSDIALGSDVTILHLNTQGDHLHSHAHNYPSGSRHMYVTLVVEHNLG